MLEKPASKTIVDRSRRVPRACRFCSDGVEAPGSPERAGFARDGVESPPAALDNSRGEKQGFIPILNLLGQSTGSTRHPRLGQAEAGPGAGSASLSPRVSLEPTFRPQHKLIAKWLHPIRYRLFRLSPRT